MITHYHSEETRFDPLTEGDVPVERTSRRMRVPPLGRVNVGSAERLVSAALGGALIVYGISRRSLRGLMLSGLGGACLYRGFTGYCHIYDALRVSTLEPQEERVLVDEDEQVATEHSPSDFQPDDEPENVERESRKRTNRTKKPRSPRS